jgi:hypothetical protein
MRFDARLASNGRAFGPHRFAAHPLFSRSSELSPSGQGPPQKRRGKHAANKARLTGETPCLHSLRRPAFALALGFRQQLLAQADMPRGHFEEFVVVDVLERLFEAHFSRGEDAQGSVGA